MNAHLISTIIPVYNAEKYVAEAIQSIQEQDYTPLEIIVVNDGSTDDSIKIIERLTGEITILNQPNAGPAAARNKGLNQAHGEFIAFLDADDVWPVNKLSQQAAYLLANLNIDVVWGRTQYFGDFSERDKRIPLDQDLTTLNYQLGSGLFRRSVFSRVGVFDVELTYSEDYDWILRALEMGIGQAAIADITLHHRMNQDSMVHSANHMNYQLPLMLKKSLDRRRKKGGLRNLPKMPGDHD